MTPRNGTRFSVRRDAAGSRECHEWEEAGVGRVAPGGRRHGVQQTHGRGVVGVSHDVRRGLGER